MQYKEFAGINSFLVGMAKVLLTESTVRTTRGFNCYELPNPIIIKITNPLSRIITIPQRQWNHILPYVESLWLASGRNDMDMVGHYVKKLYDFSDDKETMRAGYGPRLRWFNGISEDYKTGFQHMSLNNNEATIEVDQFKFVEQTFNSDPFTRQAIISLADPAKDCFDQNNNLKRTKDFPCTRNIQFIRNDNKLDVIVHMRSNDFLWGASGVNIFNFTYMQEYFAQILNLNVGNYYHIVNNFHYYENVREKLEVISSTDSVKDEHFAYKKKFKSLDEFDEMLKVLASYEKKLREKITSSIIDFGDEFFDDWAKVFYGFHFNNKDVNFINPILKSVSKRKINSKTIQENKTQFEKTFSDNDENKETYWQNFI